MISSARSLLMSFASTVRRTSNSLMDEADEPPGRWSGDADDELHVPPLLHSLGRGLKDLRLTLAGILLSIPRAPETEPIDLRLGVGPVPHSSEHGSRAVHPSAPAKRSLRPCQRPLRIPLRRHLVIVLVIPIRDPFGDVADHLMHAIGTDRILILVDCDDRRIEHEPLRAIAHGAGETGATEVRP